MTASSDEPFACFGPERSIHTILDNNVVTMVDKVRKSVLRLVCSFNVGPSEHNLDQREYPQHLPRQTAAALVPTF